MNVQDFKDKVLTLQPLNLLDYIEGIPEFKILHDSAQSAPFHCEGSVLTHSNMAAQIVLRLMEEEHITKQEDKVALYLATILHDIGKPPTAEVSKKHGRITAHGHEFVGIPLANEFLKKYFSEFQYKQREQVLRLIEHHMEPRNWMNEGTTINKMKMLSLAVNTKLLYLLSQADTLGRKANEFKSGMFALELYKQGCQDIGCWKKPYRVPLSTHLDNASYSLARWNILMEDAPEDEDTYKEAIDIMHPVKPNFQLMLLVGPPAAGKSTVRKQLEKQYPDLKVISMDDKRKELCGNENDQSKNNKIFGWQEHELRVAMKERKTTLIDATNISRRLRKVLWTIARENGALCSAIYFDIKLETLLERNAAREKRVPDDVMRKFYNAQQSICPWEADLVRVIEDKDNIL